MKQAGRQKGRKEACWIPLDKETNSEGLTADLLCGIKCLHLYRTTIHHIHDVVNGDRRLGNVSSQDNLPNPLGRAGEGRRCGYNVELESWD